MVRKTAFEGSQPFESALSVLNPRYAMYYAFVMSVIRFTTSPRGQKDDTLRECSNFLDRLRERELLFFLGYDSDSSQPISEDTSTEFDYMASGKKSIRCSNGT